MNPAGIIILLILTVNLYGCNEAPSKKPSGDQGSNQYIKYAERFRLEKKENCTVLTITDPWQGAEKVSQVYMLVRRGEKLPAGCDSGNVVFTPVNSIIAMSTTYLSMIAALGETGKITGISGAGLIYDKNLQGMVKAGKIADVGYDENLDKELIVKLKPDIVMLYGIGGESSGFTGKLREMGIRVMFNADYLENDPLGKAEWIKVFGALFLKEREADSIFARIDSAYNSVKALVREKITTRPTVLLGLPWRDTWYISPGNSYISRLIGDAGGDYIWKDIHSETSLPYGLESVWLRAINADYWLNISSVTYSGEILAVDPRLGEISAFRNGNLYNNNNRVAGNGGIDYWESGSVNPQVILKDLAAILHPEVFPGYTCYYYRKVK